jgi:hypothetical protein
VLCCSIFGCFSAALEDVFIEASTVSSMQACIHSDAVLNYYQPCHVVSNRPNYAWLVGFLTLITNCWLV